MGVSGFDAARLLLGVRRSDGLRHLVQADAVTGEPLRVDLDAQLLGAAADHEALAGVAELIQLLQHIMSQHAQLAVVDIQNAVSVEILGPHGQGDHGHIVDPLGFDQGWRNPGRHQVEVGIDLVVDLDQRGGHLLADIEFNGHHALTAL